MPKEAREQPTQTKEALATIGELEGGFDRKAFGHARFGEAFGRNRSNKKEPLSSKIPTT